MGQQFGDTTLTKVFVGGLAWETQEAALRQHFDKFGEILEAVIISDKISGRSKGYGFVTFKDAEAAKMACEDATPVINGRRANCNLASLGAKRGGGLRPSSPSTPAPLPSHAHHHPPGTHVSPGPLIVSFLLRTVGDAISGVYVLDEGVAVGSRGVSSGPPAAQWYYPHPSGTPPPPPSPFQLHHYHGALPFFAAYGYSPNYMTDFGYNGKLGHNGGGGYFQGQFSYPAAQGGMVAANGVLPMYPLYHFQHQYQSHGMGFPAHFFPPTSAMTTPIPTIISKPAAMPPPTTVCVAVDQVKGGS
ncbi:hypothetical protein Cni_G13370 [Canna indica]|uniref:RRM domain-containing protein n=1 Tax=Canna indica TaxID=4628 RepID=A0AAQ3QD13_9LILI|nr:hypothetical protein Cni_G13370 [Canna indica]